jgi:hypothetical protein
MNVRVARNDAHGARLIVWDSYLDWTFAACFSHPIINPFPRCAKFKIVVVVFILNLFTSWDLYFVAVVKFKMF